jgi:hypothetical protein
MPFSCILLQPETVGKQALPVKGRAPYVNLPDLEYRMNLHFLTYPLNHGPVCIYYHSCTRHNQYIRIATQLTVKKSQVRLHTYQARKFPNSGKLR